MPTSSAYPSLVQSALKKRPAAYSAAAQRFGRYASSPPGQARISSFAGQAPVPQVQAPAAAPSPPPAPAAAQPAANAAGERIFSALEGVDPNDTWVAQNHDAIVNRMLPAALQGFPGQNVDRIARALEGSDWRRQYFYNIAHSGFGGAPVYNRGGEGDTAGLVFVPGFRPQGVAGALSGTRGEAAGSPYGRYDPQGRYLGFRSGLINGSWVY